MSAAVLRSPPRALARALGGFGGSVLLMGGVNVAVVPIVIASSGPGLWAGVAVAQSIASFASVLVLFGWGVTGPAAVAAATGPERGAYFRDSVASRCWIAVAAIPLMTAAVLALAPGDAAADVLAAVGLLLPALGGSWFFVGERAPGRLLLLETLPRAGGTVVGAVLLLAAHAPLPAFTAAQVAGAVLTLALTWRNVLGRHGARLRFSMVADLQRLGQQRAGVVTAVTAAFYVNLPVVLAGAVLPAQAPVYAVVDKLQKLVLTAVNPVFQVAQGMVAGRDPATVRARARRMSSLAIVVGLVVGLGFAVAGGPGVAVLSGGRIAAPFPIVALLGVALASICTSAITGLACLTALGAARSLAISTVLGAGLGIPLILLGASAAGITGIAAAAAVSELVVAAYQVMAVRRRTGAPVPERRRPLPEPSLAAPSGGTPLG